jgi:hypothetical protein
MEPEDGGVMPILLASPREPSGVSWIMNCFLELGIKVSLKPTIERIGTASSEGVEASGMWVAEPGGRWRLHPRAEALKKWLPVLSRQETLCFRDDLEVLCVQELPRAGLRGRRTLLFVRDLRDALHSLYRRNQPEISLEAFARLPHPQTLLDAIGHWRLFVESWLGREGVRTYRFEDYKADAAGLLGRILDDLDIPVPVAERERAAELSGFGQAAAAESAYRQTHPGDRQVANRAGLVGEWKKLPETQALAAQIEQRAGDVLARLGYDARASSPPLEGYSNVRFLSFFDEVEVPAALREAARSRPLTCPSLAGVLSFAAGVDAERLAASRLEAAELRTLLDSLDEFTTIHCAYLSTHLHDIRAAFVPGSDYHLDRLRRLVISRRGAEPPRPS